jgi:Recombinase zinc beta ribbon domain
VLSRSSELFDQSWRPLPLGSRCELPAGRRILRLTGRHHEIAFARIPAEGREEPREGYLLRQMASCARCGAPLQLRTERKKARKYVCRNVRLHTGVCDQPQIRADVLESAVLLRLRSFPGDLEEWIAQRQDARREHRRLLQQNVVRSRFQSEQVERRIDRAQQRYDRAVDAADDERASAVEAELTRLREQASRHRENLAQAGALVEEWSAEPGLDAAREWLEDVLKVVAGKIARAQGTERLRAALRSAIADIRADVRGSDLYIDIWARAADVPDAFLLVNKDSPQLANVRAGLGAKPSYGSTR